jgi:hypothetical protein
MMPEILLKNHDVSSPGLPARPPAGWQAGKYKKK